MDYEAELAVVIGQRGKDIPAQDALKHVAGYTAFNDVSARDFQNRTSQWLQGKTFDTFGPMGPALVTCDEIPDPGRLDISLVLNGETMQHSNTGYMIFTIPEIIAYLSQIMTLEPGDVISTGTPGGVGILRDPPVLLNPATGWKYISKGWGCYPTRCPPPKKWVKEPAPDLPVGWGLKNNRLAFTRRIDFQVTDPSEMDCSVLRFPEPVYSRHRISSDCRRRCCCDEGRRG